MLIRNLISILIRHTLIMYRANEIHGLGTNTSVVV